MITPNRYPQLFDYLNQLHHLSVTKQEMGTQLSVDPTGVGRFLNKKVNKPKKMLANFIEKYFAEYSKWPLTSQIIGRVLTAQDVSYFRGKVVIQIHAALIQQALPVVPQATPATMIHVPAVANPQPQLALTQAVTPQVLKPAAASQLPQDILDSGIPRRIQNRLGDRFRKKMMETASIVISYRGHLSDKDGKGMIFDHMRIQQITRVSTKALLPSGQTPLVGDAIKGLFENELKAHPAKMLFGRSENNIVIPEDLLDPSFQGLIIIPGRVRGETEEEPIRQKHEFKVIKEALNRGQPILGICAGSWRVWQQCLAWINNPSSTNSIEWRNELNSMLVDVQDHNYNGGMLRLKNNGIDCGFNVEIHDVVITSPSLSQICGVQRMPANSVHWKAINPQSRMSNFRISALSATNPSINIKTRQKNSMAPQQDCVESFENVYGAPTIGVQWHPEGYDKGTPHANIIAYMAKAGDAYSAKRKMLAQFHTKYAAK